MAMFRRLVLISALAGLCAGLAMSVVQAARLWPLIAAAEVLESGSGAHEHAWSPDGALRIALTVAFNVAAGVGFALLLNAGARLRGLWDQEGLSRRQGLLWGIAGFTVFALAPSLGLPPELPGMISGDLMARQLWWVATVACTAGALALWAFQGGTWILAAVALAAVPHLVGAPHGHGDGHGSVPPELAAAFAAGSLAASAVFWAVLGVVSGLAAERLDRGSGLAYDPSDRSMVSSKP